MFVHAQTRLNNSLGEHTSYSKKKKERWSVCRGSSLLYVSETSTSLQNQFSCRQQKFLGSHRNSLNLKRNN